MNRIRRVTEPEVIAEFLNNEFHHREFQAVRARFAHMVFDGDVADDRQNAIRRALLFRRRGHMWRELPADTQWWQVELDPQDFGRVRVFPRAHWRRIAHGSLQLMDIVERIRSGEVSGLCQSSVKRIRHIGERLQSEERCGSVLLIGLDETSPLTVLEGNHRLTAALLDPEFAVQERFRMLCGLSPAMRECCWYETNASTLFRYARHRLQNLYDREADLGRFEIAPSEPDPGCRIPAQEMAPQPNSNFWREG